MQRNYEPFFNKNVKYGSIASNLSSVLNAKKSKSNAY